MGMFLVVGDEETRFTCSSLSNVEDAFIKKYPNSASGFPYKWVYSPKKCLILYKELLKLTGLKGDTWECCEAIKLEVFTAIKENKYLYFEE